MKSPMSITERQSELLQWRAAPKDCDPDWEECLAYTDKGEYRVWKGNSVGCMFYTEINGKPARVRLGILGTIDSITEAKYTAQEHYNGNK